MRKREKEKGKEKRMKKINKRNKNEQLIRYKCKHIRIGR